MARISVTSHGALGDPLPVIALARQLQDRGHGVLMALQDRMLDHAGCWGPSDLSSGREPLGAEGARPLTTPRDGW